MVLQDLIQNVLKMPERRKRDRIPPEHWLVILQLPQMYGYEVFVQRKDGFGWACVITEINHSTLTITAYRTDTMFPVAFRISDIEEIHVRSRIPRG
jgi:hypothetical protein